MYSWTVWVMIMISSATTRPLPSARGSSRWEIVALRLSAMRLRTISCSSAGKTLMIRPMVLAASVVCTVEKTRCPVSAALSAMSMDSASRISPDEDHVRVLAQRGAQRRR